MSLVKTQETEKPAEEDDEKEDPNRVTVKQCTEKCGFSKNKCPEKKKCLNQKKFGFKNPIGIVMCLSKHCGLYSMACTLACIM
jgi:hypothetical protein